MIEPDTLIIGAGPAGLAVGACLKREGVPCTIVERSSDVGSAWRGHYARLHLHTDRDRSTLPYQPFAPGTPRYPSREQVIAYLEAYAREFSLAPRFNEEVNRVRREGDVWRVETSKGIHHVKRVVVATGLTREPYIPDWPGLARFEGPVLHSSAFRSGEPFRGREVLVIGLGNSGGEIAIDLYEHGARPSLAVRSPVNVIPRELFGLPILAIASLLRRLPSPVADAIGAPLVRFALGDIEKLGLRRLSYGPMTQIARDQRIPLIDVGTLDLIRRKAISILPDVRRFDSGRVQFSDGTERPFDAVVLATGFKPSVDRFLELEGAPIRDGAPTTSGVEAAPGLYFCGFRISTRGMLREIHAEARAIARDVAKRS